MDPSDATSHSFVVKVWLEEVADGTRSATWRGHITHVLSSKRRYVHDVGEIGDFILTYLEAMGVRLSGLLRLRRWLRRAQSPWGSRNKRR